MKKREPMWRRYARFFGPDVKADVDDELADHVARLEAELRARGLSSAEVAAEVRARFGDADAIRARLRREDGRRLQRQLRVEAFGNMGQDVSYALRRLKQRPGFTATVLVVLALGVGATTAMFSAVDAAMLRPLPFKDPGQLVLVNNVDVPFQSDPSQNYPIPFHVPNYNDLAAMHATFASVASYAAGGLNLSISQRPLRVQVGVVTPSFFWTIGVMPAIGRPFSAAESRPGGPASAILSHALWSSHFGGRPMLDSTITLNGTPYTVIGVMPRGFGFPNQSDLWIPMTNPNTSATFAAFRSYIPSYTLARVASGVSTDQAIGRVRAMWTQAAAAATAKDTSNASWFRERFEEFAKNGFAVPLQRSLVGASYRSALLVLLGATALLLLIACANVTNLLLSEAATRRREIAVRAVLGATRTRIVRQLLTESVILAVGGVLAGVAVAPPLLRLVSAMTPPRLVGLAPSEVDPRVLAFAAALVVLTGLGFGLWPALGAARADLGEAVKSGGGHGATSGTAARLRRVLVGGELALAVALLVGTGLTLRSFARLMRVDTGLNPARTATLEMTFGADAGRWPQRLAVLQQIIARLESSPGIQAAGVVNDLPLRGAEASPSRSTPKAPPLGNQECR